MCVVLVLGSPLGCRSASESSARRSSHTHRVEVGENLYRIGLRYGVDPRHIARANGIRDVRTLRVGQRLLIPGRMRSATSFQSGVRSDSAGVPGPRSLPARPGPSRPRFAWPVRGRLSSGFGQRGGRPHEGIDIAARHGTPIFAADGGTVLFSGRMGGYGKVAILRHAGSFRTVYAHASRILVRKGEVVRRGQKIAEVGSTGRSTGPHLHFEVRRGETPQNPLRFLR